MHVLITCKFEKDRTKSNAEKVVSSICLDAEGQLTPYSVVGSGLNTNSSKLLRMSSLPASMKRLFFPTLKGS